MPRPVSTGEQLHRPERQESREPAEALDRVFWPAPRLVRLRQELLRAEVQEAWVTRARGFPRLLEPSPGLQDGREGALAARNPQRERSDGVRRTSSNSTMRA
jgi:hypothetical protein